MKLKIVESAKKGGGIKKLIITVIIGFLFFVLCDYFFIFSEHPIWRCILKGIVFLIYFFIVAELYLRAKEKKSTK